MLRNTSLTPNFYVFFLIPSFTISLLYFPTRYFFVKYDYDITLFISNTERIYLFKLTDNIVAPMLHLLFSNSRPPYERISAAKQ